MSLNFNDSLITTQDVLKVPCPVCAAKVEQPCIDPPKNVHRDRMLAARRARSRERVLKGPRS